MQKVIICQGLPASGKSTWAIAHCKQNKDYVRVCRDDLRRMRGSYWIPKQEDMITSWERWCITTALQDGHNVIVDATNLNPKYLKELQNLLHSYSTGGTLPELEIETRLFNTPVKECIERDIKRVDSVGKDVIMGMYNNYLKPKPIVQNPDLPHAIICDIDGTVAICKDRGIYDYAKVHQDELNEVIPEIVRENYLKGKYILYVSGRDDDCKDVTVDWLKSHHLWSKTDVNCRIFMRKTGDKRADNIVKKEIFEAEIKDKFYVEFVLDDRNQVVEMWRELGLITLQVADGDF